jgi:hypothetical protein
LKPGYQSFSIMSDKLDSAVKLNNGMGIDNAADQQQ